MSSCPARPRRWPTLVVALLALPVFAADPPADPVTIDRAEPAVEYKTFDPRNLPNPPPPLEPGEAAVTVYKFEIDGDIGYSYRPRPPKPGTPADAPKTWDVTVKRVTIRLNLAVTLWLPDDAPPALKAHEEGHRAIAAHYYEHADAIARALAAKVAGKSFVAAGPDTQTAIDGKIRAMNRNICDAYLKQVNEPCDRAQKSFDDLTAHGTRKSPTADEAIKQSIAAADDAPAKPATKK